MRFGLGAPRAGGRFWATVMARHEATVTAMRLERLRVLVPAVNAIVGIDLADAKQMIVVTGHHSKVLAQRTFRCRAWDWVNHWTGPPRKPEVLTVDVRCDFRRDPGPVSGWSQPTGQ
jgi:hypothetical protein